MKIAVLSIVVISVGYFSYVVFRYFFDNLAVKLKLIDRYTAEMEEIRKMRDEVEDRIRHAEKGVDNV